MKTPLLLSLLIFSGTLFAQNKTGLIKGSIYDSINDYALQSASVTIYKQADSSITAYQLSNTLGEFEIKELPMKVPLILAITHAGYKTFIKNFRLDSAAASIDFQKITMQQKKSGELDEVLVKVVQPLRMNGDTLEINPNAFKLDSNAVVEDMLLRVPGLTVWGDGTITMNGRKIEKMYVDGKPFFGGANETATQNLPKNAIEKIQVYQEKDLSKQNNMDEKKDSLYAMNIKLKGDKKKGIFGKIGAGYGISPLREAQGGATSRYTADGVLQGYNKKNQFGIAVGSNNINKEEGTGESAFSENTFKSNFRIFYGGRSGTDGGITRRTYGNLKWQHSFSESDNSQFYNRITTDYGYLNTLRNISSDITSIDTRTDSKLTTIGSNKSSNNNTSNTIKVLYENRKKYGNFVNFSANYTNQFATDESENSNRVYKNDSLNVSNTQYKSYGTTRNDNLNAFGFIRKDAGQDTDPRKNFSIFFGGNYSSAQNNRSTLSKLESLEGNAHTDIINRQYNTLNNNYNGYVNLSYDGFRQLLFGIYNFFNINISLVNSINYSKSRINARAMDLDSIKQQYISNPNLTYINTQSNFTYMPGLRFNRYFNKNVWGRYNYWMGLGFELKQQLINQKNESDIITRNITQNASNFAPSANFNISYAKENAFRINSYMWANINTTMPSIDQLYPVIDNSNRYNITVGNPNLKASKNRYFNFNFDMNRNKMGSKTGYGMSLGFTINNTLMAIGDSLRYLGDTASVRYLINVKNQNGLSANFGLNLSTMLNKKNTLSFKYNTSFSNNTRPGYIDGLYSVSQNRTLSHNFNIQYNLLDKFNISLGEILTGNRNLQGNTNQFPSSIKNYTTTSNINYFITKLITFNTSLNYQYNTAANNSQASATIWNATTTYRFMQQKAELKFTAFDLLRQNKNITNFLNKNVASTTITNGLQQYFMVTFSYYPRKFGGKSGPPSPPSGIMIIK